MSANASIPAPPSTPHPIEVESYRRLREEVSADHLPPLSRAVAERVVHATAEPGWVDDLVLDEEALAAGLAAVRAGAPVVADVRMTAAGLGGLPVTVAIAEAAARGPAGSGPAQTRSAIGMRAALARHGAGAVVVVGCAPTALDAVLDAHDHGTLPTPALVIGLPVGYVGAVEAKQRLRSSGLPSVANTSRRGGAAAAAAVLNALRHHPRHPPQDPPAHPAPTAPDTEDTR